MKTGYFTSRFRFAGKSGYYTDSDTGLVLCGARFYIPALGRFLTQDPIGQAGGLNLYEYCGDNPINKLDPSGMAGISIFGFEFSFDSVGRGLATSGAAFGTVATNTLADLANLSTPMIFVRWTTGYQLHGWNGGGFRSEPGFTGSTRAWDVATYALGAVDLGDFVSAENSIARMARGAGSAAGNYGLGEASWDEAMGAGRRYLRDGFTRSSDGRAWISRDGLRQFRGPTFKPKLGISQANFESRTIPKGGWTSNGHLEVHQ